MRLTDDQATKEALAKEFADTFGRGIADNPYKGARLNEGLAVAAILAGHSPRSEFADDLRDRCAGKAWPERTDERSAQALARAEAEVDAARVEGGDIRTCLLDVIEDLGRDSDVELESVIPALVARAGLVGEKAKDEVKYLLRPGRRCREAREERAHRAYLAELDERQTARLARRKAGLPRFDTYLINPATGRTVADEEFEAAEIAKSEAEHVEAVKWLTIGKIAKATCQDASLGAILMIVFEAGCCTRRCAMDGDGMIAEFAEAAGRPDLAGLFERTMSAAWECEGPADTEATFTRLLADEGVAAPFAFAPEPQMSAESERLHAEADEQLRGTNDSADIFLSAMDRFIAVALAPSEPAQAVVEIEAPIGSAEVLAPPTAVLDDEAADHGTIRRAGAEPVEAFEVGALSIPFEAPTTLSVPVSAAAQREAEMDALTHVPGLVGDIVNWIVDTSMKPNRTLAFSAAIVLVGTLAGRLFETETGLRTNIYALGLAPSGFGKDHARSCVNILVDRAQCGDWLGGSKIASGTAMRRRVEDHPSIMWMIDEFGGTMRQMGDVRNVHNAQIRDLLLEYFESAGDVFRGADYAGERGQPVQNPNVSLYGMSNPDSFWQACQGLSAADGLLARILAFSVGSIRPTNVKPRKKKSEPPRALIDALRGLTRPRVGGNLNGRIAGGAASVKAMTVPFVDGAEDAYYAAKEAFDKAGYAKRGRPEESIYARVVENALKIAMIVAIGQNLDEPEISVECFEHGLRVAEHCAETTLREIRGRLADNDRQREHVDVKRMIFEAGWAGLGRQALLQMINGRFVERRLDEILKSLIDGSKEIVAVTRSTKGRPAMRFVAVENLGPEDANA